MLRMCLCLLAGGLAPQLISFPLQSDLIVALLVLLVIVLPWCQRWDLVCLLAGGLLFMVHANRAIDNRLAPEYSRESMLVTVRVIDFPSAGSQSTTFQAVALEDARIVAKMRLSWFDPPVALRIGDVWRLQLVLRVPRDTSNPGFMDAETWMFRQRIGAIGYVAGSRLNELRGSGTGNGIERFRERFMSRLQKQAISDDSMAVLAAVVVGARHKMSTEQWERYARTGTSHLMAISGLHIGLAAMGAYGLARLILGMAFVRVNQVRLSLLAAVFAALGYAAISGFAIPAQRAVLMLVLTTATLVALRGVPAARILALSAVAIMAVDPLSMLAPGFRLSFAAVALLFWLAQRASRHRQSLYSWPAIAAANLVAIQLFLAFGLLPITVLTFGRISLAAPFINLLAVPLFSIVTVPLALLSLILVGPLEPLGDAALRLAAASVAGLDQVIDYFARMPGSARTLPGMSSRAWAYLLLPLCWVLLPVRCPGRHVAWLGVVALLSWRSPGPPQGCLDATMLDVGQGLAVVIATGDHVLLYDTGPSYRSGSSAAERVVLPYLAYVGRRRIDRIVVSHSDLDHAGGSAAVLGALPVGEIISGDPLRTIATTKCTSDIGWQWGDARFSVLHPSAGSKLEGNDASCVLLVEIGERRLLLTGDIEAAVEASLVRQRVIVPVDIVAVPHHGSRTSSTAPFIRSLTPAYAIVSTGHANQWGFPKSDVTARWRDAGAAVLNTATSGAISFRLCKTGLLAAPVENRRKSRRVWHAPPQYAE